MLCPLKVPLFLLLLWLFCFFKPCRWKKLHNSTKAKLIQCIMANIACRQRRRRKKSFWWWHSSFSLTFGGFSGFLCNHQEDRFTQGFLGNPRRLEHIKFISRNQIKLTSLSSFTALAAWQSISYIVVLWLHHSSLITKPPKHRTLWVCSPFSWCIWLCYIHLS